MGVTLSPSPEDITPTVSLAHALIYRFVDVATFLSNISTSPSVLPPITDAITTAKRQQPKMKDILDALQNAALALLPTPTNLEGSSLAVAAVLTTFSLLYPRSIDRGEKGPSHAAGGTLVIVASRRWKDGKVVGKDLAERMLVALLIIACSNDGDDGEVAVSLDLQMMTFLARSFRITGSGIDEVRGGAANSITTSAIQHDLSLIDGGDGSASLKCVVFGDGRTA